MSIPWMPFYPADYLADTGHLTTLEHGAYFLLILHYWSNGGLPKDENKLARIARLTAPEWASVRDTIADFFDGNWQHFRIDAELATAREKHEGRARAGAKGGKASWQSRKKSKQSFSNASAELNQPQPQPPSEPNGSDAVASARDLVWSDGKKILVKLGLSDASAGSNIGRFLKDTGDDHAGVLDAIRRARDAGTRDPIAFVKGCLRKGKPGNVIQAADRLIEKLAEFDKPAPSDIRCGEGEVAVRPISARGRQ